MRYLYVKNGDAVDQVQRVLQSASEIDPHGPDAFIGSFLDGTRGDEVHVLSRGRRLARFRQGSVSAETQDGGSSVLGKFVFRIRFVFVVLTRIYSLQPDRIVCGSTGSQLLASWLGARFLGRPLVHSRHNRINVGRPGSLAWLRSALDISLAKRATAVVAHGPYLAAQIAEVGVARDRILQFEVSFPGSLAERKPSVNPTLLFVGRMERRKGIRDLLLACRPLFDAYPGLTLEYAGDGTGRANLAAEVDRLELGSRVRLRGAVPHSDVLSLMAVSHAVVTPTRREFPEGRCMVAMESLALGVPVVAPDFGPFPYLIRHENNGLLYEPDQVEELRAALRRLLSDAGLRARLEDGARATSLELRQPQTAFYAAVARAFDVDVRRTHG